MKPASVRLISSLAVLNLRLTNLHINSKVNPEPSIYVKKDGKDDLKVDSFTMQFDVIDTVPKRIKFVCPGFSVSAVLSYELVLALQGGSSPGGLGSVDLDLGCSTILPSFHQPKQNRADSGLVKIKVNPTQLREEMDLPVQNLVCGAAG